MTSVPLSNYAAYYDPSKSHHRAWLSAVLNRLTELDPAALSEGSELRDLWKTAVETKAPLIPPPASKSLDPRGSEESGLAGPGIPAAVGPGDSYLLVNDRDQDMEAYDSNGRLLWRVPCLARGQGADNEWKTRGSDTPPGLYRVGAIYRDYEKNSKPSFSQEAMAYGWYSFDLEDLEGQEGRNRRAGIMIHGGGSACGWPGAWLPQQTLYPTLGCIRMHNVDLRDKVLPLCQKGAVYVGVFQER